MWWRGMRCVLWILLRTRCYGVPLGRRRFQMILPYRCGFLYITSVSDTLLIDFGRVVDGRENQVDIASINGMPLQTREFGYDASRALPEARRK